MGVKSIQLTEGTIKMDAFPEECLQNAVFPDLRSKICPGVLGESQVQISDLGFAQESLGEY